MQCNYPVYTTAVTLGAPPLHMPCKKSISRRRPTVGFLLPFEVPAPADSRSQRGHPSRSRRT